MIFLLHDQNMLPIKKPGFISVFCSKNIFRESGADNGGGWRQSRDLHHSPTEKTWNRKLLSDTKEKTGYRWRWSWREIASSNFAKDSTTSARFCVVSNSNKYFFIHHLVRDSLTSGSAIHCSVLRLSYDPQNRGEQY